MFSSVNCLNIIRPLTQLSKVSAESLSRVTLTLFGFFLQIVIESSVVEFISSKFPWFQHILLNLFKRMRLQYENYSLRHILF